MFAMKQVPHSVFVTFVKEEKNANALSALQEAKKENPAYQLFMDLVEKLKQGSEVDWSIDGIDGIMPHAQTEVIMASVLDGSTSGEDRAAFLQQLVVSPSFYHRCLSKLTQMESRLLIDQDTEQLADLALKPQPVSELLRVVEERGNTIIKESAGDTKARQRVPRESIWEKFNDIFSPILRPVLYAGPALAMFLVAGLWISSNWVADAGIYDQRVPYALTAGTTFDWQQLPSSDVRRNSGTENVAGLLNSLKIVLLSSRDDYQNFQYLKVINDLEKIAPLYVNPLENAIAAIPDQSSDSLVALYHESRQVVQEFNFFLGLNHLAYSRLDRLFPEAPEKHLQAAEKYFLRARQLAAAYVIETGGRESRWLAQTKKYLEQDRTKKWF